MNGKDTTKRVSKTSKTTTSSRKPKQDGKYLTTDEQAQLHAAYNKLTESIERLKTGSDDWAEVVAKESCITGAVFGMSYLLILLIIFCVVKVIFEGIGLPGWAEFTASSALALSLGFVAGRWFGGFIKKLGKQCRLWEEVCKECEELEKAKEDK